ncbi:hypothetical protein ACHAWF_018588, partial [Thalassiosira exigua]
FERLEAYSQNHGGDANIPRYGDDGGDEDLWRWVWKQRRAYMRKRQPLSDERAARLKSIGLDLTARDRTRHDAKWEGMYAKLVDYKEERGDCYVPNSYVSERHGYLGKWVCRMKSEKKKGKLSNAKEAKLAKLGFDFRQNFQWERRDNEQWDARLKELIEYKAVHGRNPTTSKKNKSQSLGVWCKQQQNLFSKGNLRQDRLDRLKDSGFSFDMRQCKALKEEWDGRFEELVQNKSTHDGRDPSRTEGDLGRWCRKQRWHFRNGALTVDRRDRLIGIGFEFSEESQGPVRRERPIKDWDTRYNDLKQFYLHYGHSNVTCADVHPNLVVWVKRQRKMISVSRLAEDRVVKLRELDFPFVIDKRKQWLLSTKRWDQNYCEVVNFYESKGHCNVGSDQLGLAKWFATMKDNQLLSKLRGKQFRWLLEKEGTSCSHEGCEKYALFVDGLCRDHSCHITPLVEKSLPKEWPEMYRQLVTFFEDHGHFNMDDDPALKTWFDALCNTSEVSDSQRRQLQILNVYDQVKGSKYKWSIMCSHPEGCPKFAFLEGRCQFHSHFASGPELAEQLERLWEDNYQQLAGFYQTIKNGLVLKCHNKPFLRHWINCQRKMFKQNMMSRGRIEKLQLLGFAFEEEKVDDNANTSSHQQWKEMYGRLVLFFEREIRLR